MSHIVSIKTELRDAVAVFAACERLGLQEPFQTTARFYIGEATGLAVKLPGWLYLAVVDTATGHISYDNFEGQWGEKKHLDAFVQAYAVCKATIEARKRGHSVHEMSLPDGSVKLTISVAGGAS